MLTLKLKVLDNWRTMVRVEDTLKKQVGEGVKATADMIAEDIRSSWSGMSPSARGEAPAVLTGVLDSSVVVDDQGRDSEGRFAGKADAAVWFIRVDTSENDPGGDNYAQALEDPGYLDRPFVAPALARAEGYYTSNIKRFVRL